MKVEAVIFDIGNVLLEWHPDKFYDARIGKEARLRMFEETNIMGVHESCDAGADFKSTIYQLAEDFSNWREEIRAWHDDWTDMGLPIIEGSVKLLKSIKNKGFPVFALTNFATGALQLTDAAHPFLRQFDHRYVSGDLKLIKPDPKIYELVEAHSKIAPSALFFTDDRQENIDAAQARGWQTHLFEGPAGLAKRLVEAGILTPKEAEIT